MLAKSDGVVSYRNSTSNHNIHAVTVPQQRVVSYRNSTSNHNSAAPATAPPVLYLIEILHQTTTFAALAPLLLGCILSKFYIKPQHVQVRAYFQAVVSYRNSTSNHNTGRYAHIIGGVVSYRNSTSNHNFVRVYTLLIKVVSYRNSTSNHNRRRVEPYCASVVSYRNSTSNHNK